MINFKRGLKIDSNNLSYEEMVMLFGKPLANTLQFHKDNPIYTAKLRASYITEVNKRKGTITVSDKPLKKVK